ncbi:MAG: hypothetical protein KDD42_04670 [Bdellovibrionales bacterium]|nr:hypothetical protein [Bdellovibrionales bacterium]
MLNPNPHKDPLMKLGPKGLSQVLVDSYQRYSRTAIEESSLIRFDDACEQALIRAVGRDPFIALTKSLEGKPLQYAIDEKLFGEDGRQNQPYVREVVSALLDCMTSIAAKLSKDGIEVEISQGKITAKDSTGANPCVVALDSLLRNSAYNIARLNDSEAVEFKPKWDEFKLKLGQERTAKFEALLRPFEQEFDRG